MLTLSGNSADGDACHDVFVSTSWCSYWHDFNHNFKDWILWTFNIF